MKMEIKIVILTLSSKYGGLCVAGIDMSTGRWVRLTTDDSHTHGAVQKKDIRYENGEYCQVLDVVKVTIKGGNPTEYQPENVLMDTGFYLEKCGTVSIEEVLGIHSPNQYRAILGSKYPYIKDARIETLGHSLELVVVDDLVITQVQNPDGKPKTKAAFRYNYQQYENMSVTDPDCYSVPDQTRVERAAIIASLPDAPYNERYYKFIAQIYEL